LFCFLNCFIYCRLVRSRCHYDEEVASQLLWHLFRYHGLPFWSAAYRTTSRNFDGRQRLGRIWASGMLYNFLPSRTQSNDMEKEEDNHRSALLPQRQEPVLNRQPRAASNFLDGGYLSLGSWFRGKGMRWSKGSSPITRCWNMKAALSLIESWVSRVACKQEAVLLSVTS